MKEYVNFLTDATLSTDERYLSIQFIAKGIRGEKSDEKLFEHVFLFKTNYIKTNDYGENFCLQAHPHLGIFKQNTDYLINLKLKLNCKIFIWIVHN